MPIPTTYEEVVEEVMMIAKALRMHGDTWQKLPFGAKRMLEKYLPAEEQPGVGPKTPLAPLKLDPAP